MGTVVAPLVLSGLATTIVVFQLAPGVEVALCALLIVGALCLVALRPVREPRRALVYRLATLHRVAGPGYVWLVPFIDRIEQEISMVEHEALVVPAGSRTADHHALRARLEVTWRIAPGVRGAPSEEVREMLLLPDERRAKLAEEALTRAAGHAIGRFTLSQLSVADTRDEAVALVVKEANGELSGKGFEIARAFWRL